MIIMTSEQSGQNADGKNQESVRKIQKEAQKCRNRCLTASYLENNSRSKNRKDQQDHEDYEETNFAPNMQIVGTVGNCRNSKHIATAINQPFTVGANRANRAKDKHSERLSAKASRRLFNLAGVEMLGSSELSFSSEDV